MTDGLITPSLIMILGALAVQLIKRDVYKTLTLALPVLTAVAIVVAANEPIVSMTFLGYQITPFAPSHLGLLFAGVFVFIAFCSILYALDTASRNELTAASVYAGSAIAVCLAGDFITLFVFWELMAIASTLVIFLSEFKQDGRWKERAGRAGVRYALIHILGGTCLLAGIVGLLVATGDASVRAVPLDTPYAWAMLIGFLINAGAPPLSAWIADAYPKASPSGSVFLASFTTKSAVYALLAVFAGVDLLIWVGLYMIFYGIIYALLENDMRRILSYSLVNQVGFMVLACGIGTPLAVNAAAAHACAHIIYKSLLMMSAGSVMVVTGKHLCTELGGLYASMRVTMSCAIVGAASMAAVPLTAGYSAKSLLSKSALATGSEWLWLILLIGLVGAFLHASLMVWFVFFNRQRSKENFGEAPVSMQLAMIILTAVCFIGGLAPQSFYALLPYTVAGAASSPYGLLYIVEQLQILLFSAFAFFLLLPWLKRTRTISLDTDWFYRVFAKNVAHSVEPAFVHFNTSLMQMLSNTKAMFYASYQRLQTSALSNVPLSALLVLSFMVSLVLLLVVK